MVMLPLHFTLKARSESDFSTPTESTEEEEEETGRWKKAVLRSSSRSEPALPLPLRNAYFSSCTYP